MQVILDLKGGGPEEKPSQSDTYDVAAMVEDQIQPLKNLYDGDAGPDDIIEIPGEYMLEFVLQLVLLCRHK